VIPPTPPSFPGLEVGLLRPPPPPFFPVKPPRLDQGGGSSLKSGDFLPITCHAGCSRPSERPCLPPLPGGVGADLSAAIGQAMAAATQTRATAPACACGRLAQVGCCNTMTFTLRVSKGAGKRNRFIKYRAAARNSYFFPSTSQINYFYKPFACYSYFF